MVGLRPCTPGTLLVGKVRCHLAGGQCHNSLPPSIEALAPSASAKNISKFCWEGEEARLVLASFVSSPLEPEGPADPEGVFAAGPGDIMSSLRCGRGLFDFADGLPILLFCWAAGLGV